MQKYLLLYTNICEYVQGFGKKLLQVPTVFKFKKRVKSKVASCRLQYQVGAVLYHVNRSVRCVGVCKCVHVYRCRCVRVQASPVIFAATFRGGHQRECTPGNGNINSQVVYYFPTLWIRRPHVCRRVQHKLFLKGHPARVGLGKCGLYMYRSCKPSIQAKVPYLLTYYYYYYYHYYF